MGAPACLCPVSLLCMPQGSQAVTTPMCPSLSVPGTCGPAALLPEPCPRAEPFPARALPLGVLPAAAWAGPRAGSPCGWPRAGRVSPAGCARAAASAVRAAELREPTALCRPRSRAPSSSWQGLSARPVPSRRDRQARPCLLPSWRHSWPLRSPRASPGAPSCGLWVPAREP